MVQSLIYYNIYVRTRSANNTQDNSIVDNGDNSKPNVNGKSEEIQNEESVPSPDNMVLPKVQKRILILAILLVN